MIVLDMHTVSIATKTRVRVTQVLGINVRSVLAAKAWKTDRPGERGAPPGHKEGMMRCLEGTDSALGEKQMQTEKEGNLSFAEAIIKPRIENDMWHA